MVESKEDPLKKVGDTPRVKKFTPKTQETSDEEMVDDTIAYSEAVNGATEAPTSTAISVYEPSEKATSHEAKDATPAASKRTKPATDSLNIDVNASE
ncbi:hypothetical protein V8E54_007558 [Elaphomyces granulatus]